MAVCVVLDRDRTERECGVQLGIRENLVFGALDVERQVIHDRGRAVLPEHRDEARSRHVGRRRRPGVRGRAVVPKPVGERVSDVAVRVGEAPKEPHVLKRPDGTVDASESGAGHRAPSPPAHEGPEPRVRLDACAEIKFQAPRRGSGLRNNFDFHTARRRGRASRDRARAPPCSSA